MSSLCGIRAALLLLLVAVPSCMATDGSGGEPDAAPHDGASASDTRSPTPSADGGARPDSGPDASKPSDVGIDGAEDGTVLGDSSSDASDASADSLDANEAAVDAAEAAVDAADGEVGLTDASDAGEVAMACRGAWDGCQTCLETCPSKWGACTKDPTCAAKRAEWGACVATCKDANECLKTFEGALLDLPSCVKAKCKTPCGSTF